MSRENIRKHEVAFCAEVSKWTDKHFEHNADWPFGSSDIESFGRGSQKRQDFRVYERKATGRGKLALCGEVKLPGTPQGRTPFDMALMQDAFNKANAENCRYFFTWNVEQLALFDRSLWDAETMHERCIGQWKLGLELNKPAEITRAEVIDAIQTDFLPRFFADFSDIYLQRKRDMGLLPSDFYIAVLESHLCGPMGPLRELIDHLGLEAARSRAFESQLTAWMIEQQWNFDRNDPQSWREAVDRAARSMVYVLSNRILFYQAVRARNQLPELKFPRSARTPQKALEYLRAQFQEAIEVTGDYEPVFFPDKDEGEWAARQALSGAASLEAWDKFIGTVDRFNFKEIPTDILGHIFQRLISPEERHKFGQHYTDETIVDLINAFCIHKGDANVIDPACGSGSFLVRAYYRKQYLDGVLSNQKLLEGLYGCDINPFPAHLATLNLAARNISNEENYPRIVRKNFFTVAPGKTFCELPKATRDADGKRQREKIPLPTLDAIVGNPPYVRQQLIPKASTKGVIADQTKEHLNSAVERAWKGIQLTGQSDLHVYFWPVAAQYLADDGWFGFLTSSSWLDAKYGFPLQRWLLMEFRIAAIIESVDEPWFEDARVKTAVTIAQRCKDEEKRATNLVRFVRLKRPLAEILGIREDERDRQREAEGLRDFIQKTKRDYSDERLRIMVKPQGELWREGLSVAEISARQKALDASISEADDDDDDEDTSALLEKDHATHQTSRAALSADYGGGKWGRYLRAPDFYFDIMREFGHRFTRLGEVAVIKRGITSGCDAFFMPRNVSADLLKKCQTENEWRALPLMKRCKRAEVESGKIVVVKCGDNTLHPIEAEYVRPELHSLMQVDRPIVMADQLDRLVLWVNQPLDELRGTYVHHFITWGSKQTFTSNKSKSVPLPQRDTVAGRDPWYDLTGLRPGIGFWPKAQKYRHIIPWNPTGISCNCNLYDLHGIGLEEDQANALMAILNSTLVGLFKHFYGRYAGAEGTLKTEVIDTLLIEIPSPKISPGGQEIHRRLSLALDRISKREVTHLVEQKLLNCHSEEEMRELQSMPIELPLELQHSDRRELDLLTFELLGVSDSNRRQQFVDRLYETSTRFHRELRVQDIQSNINRSKGRSGKEASVREIALAAWTELEPNWQQPLGQWLDAQAGQSKHIEMPEGEARLPEATNFFEATTVYFGKKPPASVICDSRAEAELLYAIANAGLRGAASIPLSEDACRRVTMALDARLSAGRKRLEELAEQRAGTDKLREQVNETLYRWFIHGKQE